MSYAFRHPLRWLFVNLLALTFRRYEYYYHTWRWQKIRAYCMDRDAHRCRQCNRPMGNRLDVHHKRPVSKGGSWHTWNLTSLCAADHAARHPGNRTLEEHARKFAR